jgi:hypothetical protein
VKFTPNLGEALIRHNQIVVNKAQRLALVAVETSFGFLWSKTLSKTGQVWFQGVELSRRWISGKT